MDTLEKPCKGLKHGKNTAYIFTHNNSNIKIYWSDHLLTILVHGMRLRLLLANISEGAYNGDAVGQFLVVLVVVLFEQGLADPLPGIFTHGARHLVLIQNHF